ncbi:hypothetical protein GWI33_002428 [Rhynchophorus ferrugineus]|uniref:Uncharacterized protein n=1 Tax=Rhynchophorus ferrugineus TaxID=354439 RepID=A0A834IVH6_RHYFE|nr:hypothetical protein GWI33_002428 [Rhynchophorus ferrugineus]
MHRLKKYPKSWPRPGNEEKEPIDYVCSEEKLKKLMKKNVLRPRPLARKVALEEADPGGARRDPYVFGFRFDGDEFLKGAPVPSKLMARIF